MPDKLTGTISLTHQVNPDTEITIRHDTEGDTELTLDYQINSDTDISVSHDNKGNTSATVSIKI